MSVGIPEKVNAPDYLREPGSGGIQRDEFVYFSYVDADIFMENVYYDIIYSV